MSTKVVRAWVNKKSAWITKTANVPRETHIRVYKCIVLAHMALIDILVLLVQMVA